VVLGRSDKNGVGGADFCFKFRYSRGRVPLVVLIKGRNAIQLKNFDPCALRRPLLGGTQRRAIVRTLAETASNSQDIDCHSRDSFQANSSAYCLGGQNASRIANCAWRGLNVARGVP